MPPSPPPIDVEAAQASQSSTQESGERRSGRLAGASGAPIVWGSDPEAEARRIRNQGREQGGITSFFNSIVSPGTREGTLPVHEPTAGQAPQSYAPAPPVRNTPPPPPQSRGSTSVPPAAAAATSSASTSNPAPSTSGQQATQSNPAPSTSGQQGPATQSNPAPPTSGQQGPATQSDPAPPTSGQQGPATQSNPAPSASSVAGNVGSSQTRSQPPSLGDRTATQSPNMPQQSQPNTGTRDILREVTDRWNELPMEDWEKLPSQLNLEALQNVFRLAEAPSNALPDCGFCHRSLIFEDEDRRPRSDVGYVRCGHAMHWGCIQRGGLDSGCPVCPAQVDGLETRPAIVDEECNLCREILTSDDRFRVLPCTHAVHENCISSGALVNGCPYCRRPISTYANWHEANIPPPTINDPTNSPLTNQTNGGISGFGGPLMESPTSVEAPLITGWRRNQERDRLLSELFHVHPDLWRLFTEERRRLEEIQNEANFDLDGWLTDFRTYHADARSNMSIILMRAQFSDYNINLDIQNPRIREVGLDQRTADFYSQIQTGIESLMNGHMDEDSARFHFRHANQIRPQDSSNEFHLNFWLPHERMRNRASTDPDRQSIRRYMGRYIRTFHNHPIMATLSSMFELQANEQSGDTNNRRQADIGGGSPLSNATVERFAEPIVQRFAEPTFGPRPGWVYDNGDEKEIRGYRAIGNGYQILLRTPAPQPGFWDHELVASHLIGGEITINNYKAACSERGEEPFLFAESSIDLLRGKSRSQVRGIISRSCFRRYGRPPAGGYLNAPMQHLEIIFMDEEGTFWYRKSSLEQQFTVPFVKRLLDSLYEESGISPVQFSPSETRQRAPRVSRAPQPNNPTTRQPFNATGQQPFDTTFQQPFNATGQQPFNATATEGLSLESRLDRLERMISQLLAGGG